MLISYTTVFRSRLGLANLILPLVSLNAQREGTLTRKAKECLSAKRELAVADADNFHVFEYLTQKKLLGVAARQSGRYPNITLKFYPDSMEWDARLGGSPSATLDVFVTDQWMSDPRVRSTIGVPTPDNVNETVEFCYQLGVINRSNLTLSSDGVAIAALRSNVEENPFVLGTEALVLARSLIERDGLMLYSLLVELQQLKSDFRRDDLLPDPFVDAARRAATLARQLGLRAQDRQAYVDFARLLSETVERQRKKAKRPTRSGEKGRGAATGPGVLEHRLSARLEWLTDLGVLEKSADGRNLFLYHKTEYIDHFAQALHAVLRGEMIVDDAALALIPAMPWVSAWRSEYPSSTGREALLRAYAMVKSKIGPSSIRDVVFIASIIDASQPDPSALRSELVAWATSEKGISLSGSRFSREPAMVRMADSMLTD